MDNIINDRFVLGKKLGSGSFGDVYIATDKQTNEEVAIKIEISNPVASQLNYEGKLLKLLQGAEGYAQLIASGLDNDRPFLVMERLSLNLEQLLQQCPNHQFSLKSMLMLIEQMLRRIEVIHNKGFVYRDIKPENFLMGKGKKSKVVYLIDFGLGKRYLNSKGAHIQYKDNKGLVGTARYVSINTHKGIEQTRRDDLESLGYAWIYLIKGRLPWQGIVADTKEEKYEKLKQKKISTSIDTLTEGLPEEFKTYVTYVRSLKFDQQPDYFYLRNIFKELFFRLNYSWDLNYDWQIELLEGKNIQTVNTSEGLVYKKGSTTYESQSIEKHLSISGDDITNSSKKEIEKEDKINFNLSPMNGKSPLKLNLNNFKKKNNLFGQIMGTNINNVSI